MKNIIFNTSIFLLIVNLSFGQKSLNYPKEIEKDCQALNLFDHNETASQLKTGDTIWSEDFGNGFPAGWTIQDASGICPWVWSNDGSWGFFNTNNGASAGTAISSTTSANGFLICDPDSANNVTYGQPSGSNYQYLESYFTTNSIDLTGHPAVVLEFQQFFRYNNGLDMNVLISTNNITWTTYTVQGNSSNNTASINPETVKINISAVAGNQPNVYIKIGWNARVYCWMIDDMKILEADENDLIINSNYFETQGLPYYKIPLDQLTDINFSAIVANNGANDQINSKLEIEVNGTTVGSSASTTISTSNSDSLYLTQSYVPAANTGQFVINWVASSDSIDDTPTDNIKTAEIEVTDYTYARDNNIKDGNKYNSGEPYEIGNLFDIINNSSVEAVDFVVDDASEVGAIVYGVLYSIDAASGDFIFEMNTDDYNLTANDITNEATITLPFFNPIQLTGGKTYLIMVGAYGDGGNTNDLVVRTAGVSEPQTSFKYDGADVTWYYTTSTPMVRMNFEPVFSIHDQEIHNVNFSLNQNSPNPFKDETRIQYYLNEKSNCKFEVSSLSGKILYEESLGIKNIGLNEVTYSNSTLSSGVYFYSIVVNDKSITKKMIIQ